jgi:transaldolase
MKFFIDTANVAQIKEAKALGVIDGVTTNPTLIAKEGRAFEEIITEICSIIDGPISVEAISQTAPEIIKEARKLAKMASQIVVKVPVTPEGLKAVKVLEEEGVKTNVTLVFSPSQALLAAKAGASYLSPFVGRLDDVSQAGMELVEQIITIYETYGFETQVIVASIRNSLHVVSAALMGADVATIPYKVIEQLLKHPLTDAGIERFLADWRKVPSKQ